MALIQEVKDGRFVEDTSDSSGKNGKKNVNNTMGQDQFLQLLVAQMQYQDPLEPTSNTEWVAQMATFSMVESLNNMQQSFDKQSAYSLVGKYVFMNDGDNGLVRGKVDYITKEDGVTKLAVGDKLYDIDKLDTVANEEYYDGAILANDLHKMIQLLPGENNLTVHDAGLVKSAREEYDKLTETQKKFVEDADLQKLRALETRMDALKATEFTGVVAGLPSVGQIEEAGEKQLIEYKQQVDKAKELYDGLTESQRQKVAEAVITQYEAVQKAMQTAAKRLPADPADEDPNDVSALLQKILSELQAQNKTGTETGTGGDGSEQASDGTGTDATGNA